MISLYFSIFNVTSFRNFVAFCKRIFLKTIFGYSNTLFIGKNLRKHTKMSCHGSDLHERIAQWGEIYMLHHFTL